DGRKIVSQSLSLKTPFRQRAAGRKRTFSKMLLAFVQATLIAGTVVVVPALAANPAANLDQCGNDAPPSSHIDGCNSDATQWLNGNLGTSKSVYAEGDSIPFRMTFANLGLGPHTVTIEWDTTKS